MKQYCIQVHYEMSEQIDLEAENEAEAREKVMEKLSYNTTQLDGYTLEIEER